MIKWLLILLPLGCFSQDLTPAQLDSLVKATWNGQTIIFDDTVRVTKIEVRKWIFWKDVIDVKYLTKSYKDDKKTDIAFLYDDRRRRYKLKDIYRYWVDGIGWMRE